MKIGISTLGFRELTNAQLAKELVAAGKGDLDYKKFVTLAAKHAPLAPLILEYVGIKDYPDALAHLRGAMRATGVKEE
jgi:sugar phosphate isomerase/epimerase